MTQRNPDPREQNIAPTNDQKSQDTQLPFEPAEQNKPNQQSSGNKYEFTDEEKSEWEGYSMDTAIARAWSRAVRSDHTLGKPTGGEHELREGLLGQPFQYAYANYEVPKLDDKNQTQNNKNNVVTFHDGRGEVCRESGL